MIWGWYQATNKPSFVGGPAGNGVGGGVGVAVGGRVGVGGAAVALGSRGECSGESKTVAGAAVPGGAGVLVAVGVAVAVGEEVGVELGSAGLVCEPGEGDAGPSTIDWPQADRKAASAVAPAPFRKRRRSIGNSFFAMSPIVGAKRVPVNHGRATDRLRSAHALHPPQRHSR
jgi:hypothetical protein